MTVWGICPRFLPKLKLHILTVSIIAKFTAFSLFIAIYFTELRGKNSQLRFLEISNPQFYATKMYSEMIIKFEYNPSTFRTGS